VPYRGDRTRCVHRGDARGERVCESCPGRPRIKVFACAVHGECSIAQPVGAAVCQVCDDYERS
jgi:hypothetical protein